MGTNPTVTSGISRSSGAFSVGWNVVCDWPVGAVGEAHAASRAAEAPAPKPNTRRRLRSRHMPTMPLLSGDGGGLKTMLWMFSDGWLALRIGLIPTVIALRMGIALGLRLLPGSADLCLRWFRSLCPRVFSVQVLPVQRRDGRPLLATTRAAGGGAAYLL